MIITTKEPLQYFTWSAAAFGDLRLFPRLHQMELQMLICSPLTRPLGYSRQSVPYIRLHWESPSNLFKCQKYAKYLSSAVLPFPRQPTVLVIPLLVPAPGRVVQTLAIAGQELGQLEAGAPGPGRHPWAQSRSHDKVIAVTLRVVRWPIVLQPKIVAQLMGDDESCGAQGPAGQWSQLA